MHAARHTVGVLHSVRFAFAFAPSRFTFDNLRDASVVLSLGGHWYELWLIEHCVVWLPGCPPPSFTFDRRGITVVGWGEAGAPCSRGETDTSGASVGNQ